jgi:hypothetical protein
VPVPKRVPIAAAIAFAAGVAVHLASPLRIAPWPIAVAVGVTLVLFGWVVLRVGWSEPSERAFQAGLLGLYAAAAFLVNSWWPLLTLLPAVGGLARWQAMEDDILRRKRS